jgi:hypothetical protein
MKEIEALTARFSEARNALVASRTELEDEQDALVRKYLPKVKRQIAAAREARERLAEAIAESPELFVKPRTVTFHGIRVGFVKGKGEIEFDDAEQVVRLIRKHYPEQFDVLVKTSYRPVKKALANLTASELRKLGIEVAETGDQVFIRDAASDVDKWIEALLEREPEEVEA